MVQRLQEAQGATFIDLDGTLLRGNSLKMFMRRLPGVLMRRHAFAATFATLWWMGWRSIRLVSHRNMKWHITKMARAHLLDEDWDAIAEKMLGKVNPAVSDFVSFPSRANCRKYIATAAPEEYSLPLSRLMGYDGVVATRFNEDKSEYEEMRGLRKLEGIQSLMQEQHLRLESFLTDHYDDIPTAREYPGLTILVNPTRKMQSIFHNVGVTRYLLSN